MCVWCCMRMVLMMGACGANEACVGCCMCVCVLLMGHACVVDEVGCVSVARVYNVTVVIA